MMRGRAAMEIIDDLEALFERRFQEFVDKNS